jgi:hypothetical protein
MNSLTIPGVDAGRGKTVILARDCLWRRLVNTKIAQIQGLPVDSRSACFEDAGHREQLISQAGRVTQASGSLRTWWTGEQCDQAWRLVHEAEAYAVAALPADRRIARMREVLFDATTILSPHDPLLQLKPGEIEGDSAPAVARELVRRYRHAWDDMYARSRSYRNRLLILIAVVTLFVSIFVAVGGAGLFSITQKDNPTTGTLALIWPAWQPRMPHLIAMIAIGTIGSVGGLLAGTRQITQAGGVYNPFFLPLHSLILKIQMGALCALAGILAILGGLAPEIKVGQWGDIAAWALIFGAAQQFLTQLVDRQVNALVTNEARVHQLKK